MALFKNPESAFRQTQGNCFLQCGKTDALNQKESKRARVCLPHLYSQTKTKRVMYLIQIF